MAWIFQLAIECGADRRAVDEMVNHFTGIRLVLPGEFETSCSVRHLQDNEGNWWCLVIPDNVSRVGIRDEVDAKLFTDLGILLYKQLRNSPPFRFALVGIEAALFRTYSELLSENTNRLFSGIVFSQDVWEQMGKPEGVEGFKPGYLWYPYIGEEHGPQIT